MKKLLIIFIIGWLATILKHFYIFPTFGEEDHDISGFEFRIKF
jgi:hypothetical protein